MPVTAFEGAVLVGGMSRRMGRDKAMLPLPDGTLLGEVAVDALRDAGAARVVAIGRTSGVLGVLTVPDEHPGCGPLGGLVTALTGAKAEVVVVLSCDLPNVDQRTVRAVLGGLGKSHDAAVTSAGGRLHPLVGAYRTSAAPTLVAALDAGERRMLTVIDRLDLAVVELLDGREATNVNDPVELSEAVNRIAGSEP